MTRGVLFSDTLLASISGAREQRERFHRLAQDHPTGIRVQTRTKNPAADLKQTYTASLLLSTGLSAALGILLALAFPSLETRATAARPEQIVIQVEDIPETRQIERPPPPDRPAVPIETESDEVPEDITIRTARAPPHGPFCFSNQTDLRAGSPPPSVSPHPARQKPVDTSLRQAYIPKTMSETVKTLLDASAGRTPEKEALVFETTRFTYAQLLDRVNRLSAGFYRLGLRKGDRLGLHLTNAHHAYETLLAAARSGLIFVPLNFMLNSRELAAIITHAGVRCIVVQPDLYPALAPTLPGCVERLIAIGDIHASAVAYESLLAESPPAPPDVTVEPADLFGLMYTSGTTGLPKGVMLTHGNIATHARHMTRDYGIGRASRGLIALPYFVGASLNGIGLPCLFQGGTVVIQHRFTPHGFLQMIECERITHVQVVPTLLVRLLESDAPGKYDTSSLELLGYGSAPMPVDRLKTALREFGPILAQMYGLTETCAMATCLRKEDHILDGSERLKSCGRPVRGVEVKIVDDAGVEVPDGGVGELIIRGPTVMKGYWETPDLTAESLRDGWFYSGDLGYRDADGYLYLTDRKKDLILTGGFNVYPKEIEEILYTHPAVFECAVIGVPHLEWGEAVHAVVALKPGAQATEPDLLAFCRTHLSAFKRPKSVAFVDEIPRNPSGKVLKRLLR